ncbi:MAG: DegV family protein [Tissierellia bacterium]|nr:DegV family protein [Tissierellia bacterium]
MEKIAILTDTGGDVSTELAEQLDIHLVPLWVNINGKSYLDGIDISPEEVYQKMEETRLTTSTPSIGELKNKYEELQKEGYESIIFITISEHLSSLNSVADQARKMVDIPVEVIDSKNISIGTGFLVIYAAQLVKEGRGFEEIIRIIRDKIKDSKVFFSVKTLKYLIEGGRIGKVQGMIGEILKVKPIISCGTDGIYYTVEKNLGDKRTLRRLVKLAEEQVSQFKDYLIAVCHGNNPVDRDIVKEQLSDVIDQGKLYLETEIAPTLSIHTGPGLVGIGIFGIE